jgi:hypothetical protein
MVGQRLLAVIQVEDTQILARQPPTLSRHVAPQSNQIAIHLNDPLEVRIGGPAKIHIRRRAEAEGRPKNRWGESDAWRYARRRGRTGQVVRV